MANYFRNNKKLTPEEIIMSDKYIDVIENKQILGWTKGDREYALKVDLPNNYVVGFKESNPEYEGDDYIKSVPYYRIPYLYSQSAIPTSGIYGIDKIIYNTHLDIRGKGVLVGILDSGINYLHSSFINKDGTSKIQYIWDQTEKGNIPEGFLYGAEYTNEMINKAIKSPDPYEVVPSRDEIGHGTFIAGVAAGNNHETYSGVAPNADLVVVKLKQAKPLLRELFLVEDSAIAYQSTDIIFGIEYLVSKAVELERPLVILFAGETNIGTHDGTAFVEQVLFYYGRSFGIATVTSAGNEGGAMHHYHLRERERLDKVRVDINVGSRQKGFVTTLYTNSVSLYEIEVISPSGQSTDRLSLIDGERKVFTTKEGSELSVEYTSALVNSANQGVLIRLKDPTAGLWTFVVYGEDLGRNDFDVWLPVKPFITEDTYFLQPTPYTTLTVPSTHPGVITVGGYDTNTGGLYVPSGRGYTRDQQVKPDIVAPAVNIKGPDKEGKEATVTMSGTSAAAAITAGACALLFEWGIVKENYPEMNTLTLNTFLRRNATRRVNLKYPNPNWGYGELDLSNLITKSQNVQDVDIDKN